MRHQPLMTWLSIAGTAIAIFLIMSDFMISNMDSVKVAPETNRDRILYGYGGHLKVPTGEGSGMLSYDIAKELYSNLEGVEILSYTTEHYGTQNVNVKGEAPENMKTKSVDENYWKIYDYDFIEGRPFSREEVEAGIPIAIVTQEVAENLFGRGETYVGREIMVSNKPRRIVGVVGNINRLMTNSISDVFLSHVAEGNRESSWYVYLGSYTPILLIKPGVSQESIQKQVAKRYELFNQRHKAEDMELIYHNQPWTTKEKNGPGGSNSTPDSSKERKTRLIGYAILLLIPAINLSSMSRSRMRQRVGEIGLRRAFGCTRWRILLNLLSENLIITIIGGLIGTLLSMLFITGFSNYFISYGGIAISTVEEAMSRPTIEMLFSLKAFGAVLLFCFILNLLSAGIPALKAAFINPAEALTGHNGNK